ncbi:MBL fold metallo-hydrolase, partial [Flavobacteriaceae bacterium]|nr:MBL fold metallo-hydrolase [Flavobacteriaceae bacterium]
MKITFLGTGTSQGIPFIGSNHPVCLSDNPKDKRLRVSVLVEWSDFSILIDCGPDFRQQLLRTECTEINAVLFTHEHSDHTAGLDDLRPFFYRQGAIDVYANERVLKSLYKRFDYIFKKENKYPGVLTLNDHQISGETFNIGSKTIIPINVLHNTLPIFGYRIDNFAYITDAKKISKSEIQKLKNLDVLVVNALRIDPHVSHFNLEEALCFIKLVNPKKAYLT